MIICEVGVNHLGSKTYSDEYFKTLMDTDCDAVTYQIREKDFYERDEYRVLIFLLITIHH